MSKILIVDDEKALRDMYGTILTSDGFEVVKAKNGMEGCNLAVKEKPDLILLDYKLPDITGLQVLQNLKTDLEKEIPVLLITNYAGDFNNEEILEAGAKEILLKYETNSTSLLEKIKFYLQSKKGSNE